MLKKVLGIIIGGKEDTMPENLLNLARGINLDSRSWENPKQNKQINPHQAILSLWKLFSSKLEGRKRNDTLPTGDKQTHSTFLIRDHGSRKEMTQYFWSAERTMNHNINPVQISFRNKEDIKTFSGKGKLKELDISRPPLKIKCGLRNFSEQKGNCKKGTLGNQENVVGKSMGKYVRLSFSWGL